MVSDSWARGPPTCALGRQLPLLSLSPHPFWCRMSTSITQKLMKSFHKRYSSDQAAHSGFSISSPTDLDLASRLSHGRFGSLIGKPTSQAKQVSNPYACSAGRTLALTSTARSSISTTAGRYDGCCLTQTPNHQTDTANPNPRKEHGQRTLKNMQVAAGWGHRRCKLVSFLFNICNILYLNFCTTSLKLCQYIHPR